MQLTQMNSTNKSQLPSINQLIINKEFVGIANQLEDRRRERRSIDQQARILENRVLSLEKEQHKTDKEIKEKQVKLAELLSIRKRQQEDRLFKESLNQSKQRYIELRHKIAEQQRQIHQINKQTALTQIAQSNKTLYHQGRKKHHERQHVKQVNKYIDMQERQARVDHVNALKEDGRAKVVKFKQAKNSEFIDQYKNRMERQELKKSWKATAMKQFQKREQQLIQKLQKSTAQKQLLQQSFENASRLGLKELQNCVMGNLQQTNTLKNTIDTRTSGATSYSDRRMSLIVGHSRDRLNIEEYRKHRRSQMSNTLDTSVHKQLIQSQKEIKTPKIGTRDDNIQEELLYGKEEQQEKELSRINKRKRNKHANRYKDYEIF